MRGDWKDSAMQYRDIDIAAQQDAEKEMEFATMRAQRDELLSSLTVCLAALDAVATGATLTEPGQFAINIRTSAREAIAKARG